MSDKNISLKNIDLNNSPKNQPQENASQQKISLSPKLDYFNNFQSLFNTEINQRNFPSKANYFGQSGSQKRNDISLSPGKQSPVLSYYSNLSPKFSKVSQNYSPEQNQGVENAKFSPFMGGNEQTFNFSPSTIFNVGNQKSNNNNSNYIKKGEGLNNSVSLTEKMQHLVGKNDDKIQYNDQKSEEDDDNGDNEMYFLSLNICDDKENEEEINNNAHNIQNCHKNNDIPNQKNININNENNANNLNCKNQNIQQKTINISDYIKNPSETKNNINNNDNFTNMNYNMNINNAKENIRKNELEDNNNENKNKNTELKEEILEKIVKIDEEIPKPFIPNKYKNNLEEINKINKNQNENILPSYGGTINNNGLINNFTINNNINNNFNINNNIINNNLIGNPNINIGYNNINNQGNNFMMMNNSNNNPFQMMNEKEVSPYPTKIGEFLKISKRPPSFVPNENNKFEMYNMNNNIGNYFRNNNYNGNNANNSYINNFYYNGDNYQISQFKQYKKSDSSSNGKIHSICEDDFVTVITANNKKVKRIDPNVYLNESLEYLSHNILQLAKDQAGCRFLQEKMDKEPIRASNLFFEAILPNILSLIKDPFGNYLIQKIINNLNPEQIIRILEVISPTILDIGSNNHGTRVIQHLINFLTTKELVDCFCKSIEPYVIPLLKELNGTHIIQQFLLKYPEYSNEINKIIIENCASLASHSHGCCVLQKFLNGKDKNLKDMLINNLINNCLVLIIDQYGNYVIQSILLLNESKSSSAIAMKILDNVAYYSKHRYSSNVVEKCFDFCGKNEIKKLAEKLSPTDVLADLIMDEHGNYVIQKALSCCEIKEQEIILKNIIPLIPKIKNVSFGEKLLSRLMAYPLFKNNFKMMEEKSNTFNFNNNNNMMNMNYNNYNNYNYNNNGFYKRGDKKKRGGKNNNNYFDNNIGFNNNFYNNNAMNNNMSNNLNMNNNNMFFNNNDNFEEGRNNKYGNEGKNQFKNRGNKKKFKNSNWRDYNGEIKKGKKSNKFNINKNNDNIENNE